MKKMEMCDRRNKSGERSVMQQNKGRLWEQLQAYAGTEAYPFHMPGHKRNKELLGTRLPYYADITEIYGFDDLHHPDGVILELQDRAAAMYHAGESFLLVNGSSAGILAAIMGCVSEGGRILAARNCHRSVYHAMALARLQPVYLYPEPLCCEGDTDEDGAGEGAANETVINETVMNKTVMNNTAMIDTGIAGVITAEMITEMLARYDDIEAIVLTSPTYEGVVSPISDICRAAHEANIPVIVDEAHGAHLGFHDSFPPNSNTEGADVVIHSLHKTMPSLTQTALLHCNSERVDAGRIKRYLDIFQSSSPSYILMGSIDVCISLMEQRGEVLFRDYAGRLNRLREKLSRLRHLTLLSSACPQLDPSKIVILTSDRRGRSFISGTELARILRQDWQLEVEMAACSYVIAMTSPADTDEGFRRLEQALYEIDMQFDTSLDAQFDTSLDTRFDTSLDTRSDTQLDIQLKKREPKDRADEPWAQVSLMSVQMCAPCGNTRSSGAVGESEHKSWPMLAAWDKDGEWVQIAGAAGRHSAAFVYAYPPGIPYLAPGEYITDHMAEYIQMLIGRHVELHGISDGKLYVLKKTDGEQER